MILITVVIARFLLQYIRYTVFPQKGSMTLLLLEKEKYFSQYKVKQGFVLAHAMYLKRNCVIDIRKFPVSKPLRNKFCVKIFRNYKEKRRDY